MSTIVGTLARLFVRLVRVTLISLFLVILTTYGWWPIPAKFQNDPSLIQTAQRLETTVRYLSEGVGIRNYASYEKLERAARYIDQSFKDLGYSVEGWTYEAQGRQFRNVVANIQSDVSREYILVGAHYDSCFTPGADDNGTGIAALLELARTLRQEKIRKNILFVAFTNEEPPFFRTPYMGSRVFIKQLEAKKMFVREAIVLDMLGFYSDQWFSQKYLPLLGPFYPNQGNFIALVGDFQSRKLVNSIHKEFNKQKLFPMRSIIAPKAIPGINFSDHASFWEAGVPAVMVTDTAYLRNQNYHRETDTIDKLNFSKMAAVVEGLRRTIVRLSN